MPAGCALTASAKAADNSLLHLPLVFIDGQNLLALLAKHGFKFKIELA